MMSRILPSCGVILVAIWLLSPAWKVEFSAHKDEIANSKAPQNQKPPAVASNPALAITKIAPSIRDEIPNIAFHDSFQSHSEIRIVNSSPSDFFSKQYSAPPAKFEISSPRFTPNKSCKKTSQELKESFRSSAKEERLLDEKFIPDSGKILDLNLYFSYRGKYYQLSLEPDSHEPEKYRISLIRSLSVDFLTQTERIIPPRQETYQQYSNQSDAVKELSNLVQDYTDQGAQWGLRTALLTSHSASSSQDSFSPLSTRIELHGGEVFGFMNQSQECHLNETGELECLCW